MLINDLKLYGRNEEINPFVQTVRVFSSDVRGDPGI